ncbi:hypothetical protein GCM10027511_32680 [Hymenobacter humi]
MFSDFPNLHPLVVHFPIVLLLLSTALQALLVYKDWPVVKWITIGVMAGGFLGALAASTIFHAMPSGLPPKAAAVFDAHEKFAGYTLWLSGITLLLAGIGQFFKLQRRAYEVLVLVSALATAGVLSVAGHRGAQLVYVEGVGPQGRLVMKGHHQDKRGEAPMPGMEREEDGHEPPATTGQPSTAAKVPSHDIQGMDMRSEASPKKGSDNASVRDQMGDMDMSGSQPSGQARPAPRAGAMPSMPGMKMPASKNAQPMPKSMNMNSPAKPKQMKARPVMADMPGMNKQPAGAKKPTKAKSAMEGMPGMGNMADMPGKKTSTPKQPSQSMPPMENMKDMPGMEKGQAMPAMGSMPGMSMPANPMDKFRFEDNNPARNKPKPAKQ